MSAMTIPMPREHLERVVRQVIRQQFAERLAAGEPQLSAAFGPNLVVNISARHMHMAQRDLETLFGPGAELTVYRWLYQPGEFASEQRVTVLGPRRRMIENVRILGPLRDHTQLRSASPIRWPWASKPPAVPPATSTERPAAWCWAPRA